MKKLHTAPRLLCLAIVSALSAAAAAEDDIERLTKPESTVTLGIGDVNTDNQRFGTYNGMAEASTHPIGEASILRKYGEGDTWFRLDARNLGLSTREFSISHEKQGDWGYALDYSQIPRQAPYEVHTRLQGIGTNAQTVVNGATAATPAVDSLKTERFRTTFGFMKYLNPQLEFALKFQNEKKEGDRMFGHRNATQVFLAEPIDSVTRQIDMTLAYLGQAFQLTGGYYGSFYENRHKAIVVTGDSTGTIGLPPDNEAHQFYLTGAYDFTRSTRATFKYSYSKATQTDAFVTGVATLAGMNRTHLGGRMDTTLLQAGISSRPIANLSLLANLRYEDRDDKTDLAQYITAGNTTTGFNERRALKKLNGKAEASYQLSEYRLTGGVDYEEIDRSTEGVRVVGYRKETEETSYRLEVKRSLSDSVSGTIGYVAANRKGSDFADLVRRDGTPLLAAGTENRFGYLQPIYIADRDRQKLRLLADWSPVDALSVQFTAETSDDKYADRDRMSAGDMGVRSGGSQLYSIDASYAINDNWKLNGYASVFATQIEQAAAYGTASGVPLANRYWTAAMKSTGTNFGFGITGKPGAKIRIGADILWAEDRNTYKFGGPGYTTNLPAGSSTALSTLPDINWVQTTFKLHGTYAYDKDTTIRLDYVHDRRKTDDWTWTGYAYADGTWVGQEPLEKVHFLGASVQYSFR